MKVPHNESEIVQAHVFGICLLHIYPCGWELGRDVGKRAKNKPAGDSTHTKRQHSFTNRTQPRRKELARGYVHGWDKTNDSRQQERSRRQERNGRQPTSSARCSDDRATWCTVEMPPSPMAIAAERIGVRRCITASASWSSPHSLQAKAQTSTSKAGRFAKLVAFGVPRTGPTDKVRCCLHSRESKRRKLIRSY